MKNLYGIQKNTVLKKYEFPYISTLFFISLLGTTPHGHGIDFKASLFFTYTDEAGNKAVVFNGLIEKKSEDVFLQATFEFPKALERAREQKLPVVMFVPTLIKGFSPLTHTKEWIEGIRVALTWASMYSRFKELGSVPVAIVQTEQAPLPETIHQAVRALFKKCDVFSTLTNLEARFFHIHDLLKNSLRSPAYYSLEPFTVERGRIENVVITPHLSELRPNKKRFLITGAAGFIGSHLTRALLHEGHQVIGLDNFLCSSRENIEEFLDNTDFFFAQQDVTQPFTIDGSVDYIIHLASVPSPEFYYRLPKETITSGLHGTRNMLDLAVEKKAQFLFSSTSEVYGDPEITPQDETYAGNVSPIGQRSQYDQSKRGGETLIKMYFEQYGVDVRIARIFNTYGPSMNLRDGRVVTNFMEALLHHKPMKIYGNGLQTRSFSYISDTVQGLLNFIHLQLPNETPIQERVINIGSTHEFTIIELANLINDIAPTFDLVPTKLEFISPIDTTDPRQRCPDTSRAKNLLQYEASIPLEDGLEKTLAYFVKKENHEI